MDVLSASRRPRALVAALAALCAVAAVLAAAAPAGAAPPKRNGTLIYQGKGSEKGYLYLRRADGSGLRRIRTAGSVAHPAFSPLGRRVAYASLGQIWVMSADGTGARMVTSGPIASGSPTWSPAGDQIAFARGPSGARDIWAVGADGNGARQITFSPADDHSPSWSPRGQLAFVRREPVRYALPGPRGRHRKPRFRTRLVRHLWVANSTGTFAGRLTATRYDDDAPSWSADGRRIAFVRSVGGRRDLVVMNADGTGSRLLTRRGDVVAASWSPDGRYIAFTAGRAARRALYVLRVTARPAAPRRVTPLASDATAADWQPVPLDPVIAAAGDIACAPDHPSYNNGQGIGRQCHQRQVSDLLLKMDLWAVLALGDLQYDAGQYDKFMASFDPTWGRLRSLLRPVPGNHEYGTPGAQGYFDYFDGVGNFSGPVGRRDQGWYSFDVGTWHVVALNSECSDPTDRGGPSCAAGSPQEQWLRADLAAHPNRCTLAYWHHPIINSGSAGINAAVQPLWQALYDGGADLLLVGHDHSYERFAPMDGNLQADPARGVRQFLVGTGGRGFNGPSTLANNSEIRQGTDFGALKLVLHPGGYDWSFVSENPGGFADTGSGKCH